MKIRSATVTNYRVHEAVTVEFHDSTSLIGGNNEAGKSTLVEAIHRALFLPAKGDTSVHKAMRREGAKEKPEVTVCFEHAGREYELRKHFNGNTNYTCELCEKGRPKLEGDAAEDLLRELTGAGLEAGKRPNDDVVRKPWAHLWVWQGAAGDTPTDFIEGATDQLVQLTSKGAGTVTMTLLETSVAAKFQAVHREVFGERGSSKAKARSGLGLATSHQDDCEGKVRELRTQVQKLEGAAGQHARAALVLAEAEPKRAEKQDAIVGLRTEITAAQGIKASYDRALETHRQLLSEVTRVRQQDVNLKEWNGIIERLTAKFAEDKTATHLEVARVRTQEEKAFAKTALDNVRKLKEPLAKQQSKAEARVELLLAQKALQVAQKNADRVAAIRRELKEVDVEMKGLPEVKDSTIDFLRQHEQNVTTLETKLQALQSTLELLSGAEGVQLNGQSLPVGEMVPLKAESRLTTATGLELRLIVPGVADAEAVQIEIDDKRAALTARIQGYVIRDTVATSVQQLADVVLQREGLVRRQTDIKMRLRNEQAEQVATELETAKTDLVKAQSRDQILPTFEAWTDPHTLEAAKAVSVGLSQDFTALLQQITDAESHYQVAESFAETAQKKQTAFAKTRQADEVELNTTTALRQNLLAEHNASAQIFERALYDLEQKEATAGRELKVRRTELDSTELDVLESRERRLVESLQNISNEISAATRDLHQAAGQLKADGDADPFTELRDAEALLARAEADCQRETLDAQSNALLHDLFQEELDAANERITKPLADMVQTYLKRLFGPSTTVDLKYEDGKFGEFMLIRPQMSDHPEAFGTLSGGAREQVAAAVRLATAQILAADYGGQLPVVFDDAFVNTDPDRIPGVIDMLFHAAENGLQVIVSTCDPSRYQDIGKAKWTVERGIGARRV